MIKTANDRRIILQEVEFFLKGWIFWNMNLLYTVALLVLCQVLKNMRAIRTRKCHYGQWGLVLKGLFPPEDTVLCCLFCDPKVFPTYFLGTANIYCSPAKQGDKTDLHLLWIFLWLFFSLSFFRLEFCKFLDSREKWKGYFMCYTSWHAPFSEPLSYCCLWSAVASRSLPAELSLASFWILAWYLDVHLLCLQVTLQQVLQYMKFYF